jgi:tetratricopeptide (TPR) repeat protein
MTTPAVALLVLAADIVHLKSGGQQEGKLVDAGDSWRIERGNGVTISVKKSEVREIVRCKYIPEPPRGARAARWGERHVDAARFVRLDLPAGWRRGPSRGKAAASFFHDEAGRLDLLLQRGRAGAAAETFRAALADRLGAAAVTAGPGWVEAPAGSADEPQRLLWLFVEAPEERVLTLAYAGPKAAFEAHAPSVREAASWLRGLPERELTDERRAAFVRLWDGAPEDDPRRAVEMLAEARAIVADFAPLELRLARAYAALADGPKAEAAFRRALELDPSDLRAAVAFGAFLNGRTGFAQAEALLDPLHERVPDSIDLNLELARAVLGRGKALDALACARHAARLDRRCVEAHLLAGRSHERLGDRSAAVVSYRDALAADPESAPAREALERLGWKNP